MAQHFKQFVELSEELGIMLPDQLELSFQMALFYHQYKTKKTDKKAVVYFKRALHTAEKLKEDTRFIYLYLARIHYRQGDYTLAKWAFGQYPLTYLNPFSKADMHAFLGPYYCTLQIYMAYMLPNVCLQLGHYIFRSQIMFCWLPIVLVSNYLFVRYKQKSKHRTFFQHAKRYPLDRITGPLTNLVCSSKGIVAFENQHTIYLWDTRKAPTDEHIIFNTSIAEDIGDGLAIKKLRFSSDGMWLFIFFVHKIRIINMAERYKEVRIYADLGSVFVDMEELYAQHLLVLGEKNETAPQTTLEDTHCFYVIDMRQKVFYMGKKDVQSMDKQEIVSHKIADISQTISLCFSDVSWLSPCASLHCDGLKKRMVVVGSKHIYFDELLYMHPHTRLVVESYCSEVGIAVPIEILNTIFLYIRLCFVYALENQHSIITTAQFSANSKLLAIGSKNKNRVLIYNVANIRDRELVFEGYIPSSVDHITQLMWAHDDSVLYVLTKTSNRNDYRTFLFFVSPLPEKRQIECLQRGFYLPFSCCAFTPGGEKGAFTREAFGQQELFYATIPSFQQKALQEEARWISRKWLYLSLFLSLSFLENTLYYG